MDHYVTPAADLPGCLDRFRPLNDNSSCPWPLSNKTEAKGLNPSYCETDSAHKKVKDADGKYSCFPILYFTVNYLIGWIPQKNASSDKGSDKVAKRGIYLSLDWVSLRDIVIYMNDVAVFSFWHWFQLFEICFGLVAFLTTLKS